MLEIYTLSGASMYTCVKCLRGKAELGMPLCGDCHAIDPSFTTNNGGLAEARSTSHMQNASREGLKIDSLPGNLTSAKRALASAGVSPVYVRACDFDHFTHGACGNDYNCNDGDQAPMPTTSSESTLPGT